MGGRYSDSTAILEISFPIYCSTEATIHPKSSFQPFDLFLHELCIAESASSPFVISCSNGQWCCPGQFDLFVWWKISQSCNVHFLPISLPHLFQSPSFSLFMPLPFQLLDRASCLTLIFHCLPLFLRRACYNSAPSTSAALQHFTKSILFALLTKFFASLFSELTDWGFHWIFHILFVFCMFCKVISLSGGMAEM